MTRAPLAVLGVALLLTGGCARIVDANGYGFDDVTPLCPPVTEDQCRSGERFMYLVTELDTAREDTPGVLNGLNLDHSTDTVCGHEDFTAPDGTPGIDNQFVPLVLAAEASGGFDLAETSHQSVLDAMQLNLVDVTLVDDLEDDPCVQVTLRQGRPPAGMDASILDQEAPFGDVDVGVRLDYLTGAFMDPRACIQGGRLLVDFGGGRSRFPLGEEPIEISTSRNRINGRITPDRLLDTMQGGAVDTAEFSLAVEEGLGFSPEAFLSGQADLDPNGAGRCESLSFGFELEGVRVEPGNLL